MAEPTVPFIDTSDYEPSAQSPSRRFRVEDIQRITALEFGVDPAVMTMATDDPARNAPAFRNARNVALYLCGRFASLSSPKALGQQFGGRDHSALRNARTKVEQDRATNAAFAAQVAHLEAFLEGKRTAALTTPARQTGQDARVSQPVP